jgi:orotate phosphoribosyltransferase|tara:strand:- start:255 stop:902 length:648 start_codon:yes stop_codon:yes gene_type:complete
MENYKQEFIKLSLDIGALRFGEFKLKSGRISPYFFNMGIFSSGRLIKKVGDFYASALLDSDLECDIIFGPAYKGIPIVTSMSAALSENHGKDIPFVYNRKEVKDHGEGGGTVGINLSGSVVIVDDVITAGTAIRDAAKIIKATEAKITGILISLNRQEKGSGELSAVQEISNDLNVPVISIVTLDEVIEFIAKDESFQKHLENINAYRQEYGVKG